jgi:hypothetical protein
MVFSRKGYILGGLQSYKLSCKFIVDTGYVMKTNFYLPFQVLLVGIELRYQKVALKR